MAENNKIQNLDAQNGGAQVAGNDDQVKKAEKKPNIFKRAWGAIKSGVKAVRESPKAAIIGAVVGTAATIGVSAYLDHRTGGYIPGTLPEPDEPIEIEDDGEDYVEGPADDDGDE